MRWVKPRKKRGMKLNGERSYDLCECCYSPFCDPALRHPKVEARMRAGLCPACGQPKEFCKCRSSQKTKTYVLVTHNNKKRKKHS